MIEWGGWKYDEANREIIAPVYCPLKKHQGEIVKILLLAEGNIVRQEVLETLFWEFKQPKGFLRHTISRIRAECRATNFELIETLYGVGYRALALSGSRPVPVNIYRQQKIIALLQDQFEATGPHARLVTRTIEELFAYSTMEKTE